MLKILREKQLAKKIIFWALVVVSVVAFILWGAGAYKENLQASGFAGTVFKRKVPYSEYNRIQRYLINSLRMRFGEEYNKIFPYINLENEVWLQIIMLEYAKKEKIKVPDQEVVNTIYTIPVFLREGKFNPDVYKRVMRYYLNLNPREFEEQTRNELILKKLYEKITSSVSVDDKELLEAYKKEFEQISIDYMLINPDDFRPQINISEEETQEYFKKNLNQFLQPESVKIEYLGIPFSPDASDKERQKVYDEVRYSYQRIKNAQEFKNLLGKPFIYRETDFFTSNQPISEIGLDTNFYLTAFSLKENEISPIIQAKTGVFVLRALKKKPSYIPEFNEAKEKVREMLLKARAVEKGEEYKRVIDEAIKADPSFTLKKAQDLLKAEVKTSTMFSRTRAPDDLLTSSVINTAFSLKVNQISNVLSSNNCLLILSPNKLIEIDTEKFNKEKETYQKKILEAKKNQIYSKFINDLIALAAVKKFSQ